MCTHLHKRGDTYYFRRRIPLDLVELFGKHEFNESLGTKDRRTAVVACRKRSIVTDTLFERARQELAESGPAPAPAAPMTPEQERAQADWEEWNTEQGAIEALFEDEIRADKANKQAGYRSLMAVADSLGLGLPEADKQALQAIFARKAEGVAPKPTDKPAGLDLDDLVDKWAAENKPAAKTVDRTRVICAEFAKMTGVSTVGRIERKHVIQYKDGMLAAGQTPSNINSKLTLLRAALGYAVRNALGLDTNPGTGINATDKVRARDKRDAFDEAALQAIFSSPVYSQHLRPRAAGGEAAYWLPLLALFTGARMEELAQLRPEDVYEEGYRDTEGKDCSAWVIRFVNNTAEGQQVKNAGSERRVPVHAELVRLGWLDAVKQAKGKRRIFHQFKADIHGSESGNFSKWFGRYLRKVCGVADKRMVFHSFRHTFKHICRALMIPDSAMNAIQGHTTGDIADNYGGLSYPLYPLVEAMKRYRVPGLVLPGKPI